MLACNDAKTESAVEGDPAELAANIDLDMREKFREVRALHDQFMPYRGDVIAQQRRLEKSKLDSTVTAFAKTRLTRADDAMMTWMYNDEPLMNLISRLGKDKAAMHLDIRGREMRSIGDSMKVAVEYAKTIGE